MTDPISPDDLHGLLDRAAAGQTSATFDQVLGRAQRLRRNRWTVATAAVVAVTAAAIGVPIALTGHSHPTTVAAPNRTRQPAPDQANPQDDLKLVNRWVVHAPGVSNEQLVIGDSIDGGLVLFAPCGELSGDWLADPEGGFLAQISGGDEACFKHAFDGGADPTDVPWLDRASTFTVTNAGVELNDAAGEVTARLTLSHTLPPSNPHASDGFRIAKLTSDLRGTLAAPAPLPPTVTPATRSTLLGWWKPIQADVSPHAFIQFQPGGDAVGSDGCNGAGGRYALGEAGALLTVQGGSTLVGCRISRAVSSFGEVRGVGLTAGGDLEFFDAHGKSLGELSRVPTAHIVGSFTVTGGPAIDLVGRLKPLSGQISAQQVGTEGAVTTDTTATHGGFSLNLPAGTWSFSGQSSQYVVNGKEATCRSLNPTYAISAGTTVRVVVACQRK